MTIVYRLVKGSRLTNAELDENFRTINDAYATVAPAIATIDGKVADATTQAFNASQSASQAAVSAGTASDAADTAISYQSASSVDAANAQAARIAAEAARDSAFIVTGADQAELAAESALLAQSSASAAAQDADDAEAARIAAELAEVNAELAQSLAEAARDAAFVNADVYADVATGLAAVADGEQFQAVSGDEIIRYRRDAGPVAVEVARYPSAAGFAPLFLIDDAGTSRQRFNDERKNTGSLKPKAAVVVLLGQSLNAPRGAIIKAKGSPTAKMPFGGAAIASWQFNATNATFIGHWTELASVVEFEERTGQTPMVGIVSAITGGKFAKTYIGSVAIGARSLEVLMTGGPVTNLWAMLYRLCKLARADGYDPEVFFYTAHGEANASAGTSEATYYDLGMEYYSRAQLYAAQAMRKPGYKAPIVFTYPAPGTIAGLTYAEVKEAIRRLAIDIPNAIDLGSIYQWPLEADRVHPTGPGYIERGEAVGVALRSFAESSKKWGALHIIDVTLSGSEFVATFSAPVVRDATVGVGQNLNSANAEDGLEWFDNGTGIAITALSYEGWNIRGTLASIPVGTIDQQVLRIASQTITAALATWPANVSGSLVRAQGDAWPSMYDYTYSNYTWAAPQVYDQVRAI